MASLLHPPDLETFREFEPNGSLPVAPAPNLAQAPVPMPVQLDLSSVTQPLVGFISALAQAQNSAEKPAPTTTTISNVPDDTSPPVLPLPDDLNRFLSYAATNCGVSRGGFEYSLQADQVGPDVIATMEVSELLGYGIKRGDAHRMKQAAAKWWAQESQDRKRKRQLSPVSCLLDLSCRASKLI